MKQFITHDDFSLKLLSLINKINHRDFQFILGIQNGGLHLSEKIADHFKMPHYSVKISFYHNDKRLDAPIININDLSLFYSFKEKRKGKFLWVDDIVDSGSTLKWFIDFTGLKKGEDFYVVSMHWCKENSPDLEPEFHVESKKKSDWIVYPWEVS